MPVQRGPIEKCVAHMLNFLHRVRRNTQENNGESPANGNKHQSEELKEIQPQAYLHNKSDQMVNNKLIGFQNDKHFLWCRVGQRLGSQ